jgi:structural maintenance of chromosome 3 (chondroitin sulfate proteoglycan 6)
MERTEQGAKDYMKSFIIDFEKHFIRYFLRVVPGGKAELKTKIFSQKIKGLTKNGHSLEIKVSFNEEEGIRKWNEFSGGQKTVLALCIILAVQKCSPTPFCVLDEVDAALDPFYVEKLVEVIIEESEFCQYFITSFKKQMLDFPENIASYFLVKNVDNRISTLT